MVEVESLAEVFGSGLAPRSVPLGSVKSNIGHLKAAAGAAGLLKLALALHHRLLPPSLNCERKNPNIDFGSLIVQRNAITLYTFRLDNIFGDTSAPLVTPIELLAGEQLVVQVTCTGLNDPTFTTCNQNVFVSGVLLPA